jgi:hypothetical protein
MSNRIKFKQFSLFTSTHLFIIILYWTCLSERKQWTYIIRKIFSKENKKAQLCIRWHSWLKPKLHLNVWNTYAENLLNLMPKCWSSSKISDIIAIKNEKLVGIQDGDYGTETDSMSSMNQKPCWDAGATLGGIKAPRRIKTFTPWTHSP